VGDDTALVGEVGVAGSSAARFVSTSRRDSMGMIAAQVSLYPLRQPHLSAAIEESGRIFKQHGLAVRAGTMSTLITGDTDAVFEGLKEAFRAAGERGDAVMVVTLSNACPVTGASE
jgi:uncharacterized protein YqgV (UPF0045/DUF77 family)